MTTARGEQTFRTGQFERYGASMAPSERAALTRSYYDEVGEAERDRLNRDIPGRVSFEVHRRFLRQHIHPGDRVLEIGAGPGRFTAELATLGAQVLVTDISPVQLDLNHQQLGATAAETAIEARELLDVCDTSRFTDGEFDAVVAFGGPLSYAFEEEIPATQGLLRILAPEGFLLGSVMSMLGTWRHHFTGVTDLAEVIGEDANDRVLQTGDLRTIDAKHACRMFRASEVRELIWRAGGTVTSLSASNWASLAQEQTLLGLEANPHRWARFLDQEERACREPGALDGGTHILFAGTHRS